MHRVHIALGTSLLLAGACLADGPTFDAASVKLSDPAVRPPYGVSGGPGTGDPGRFHASHIRMVALLIRAFGVSNDQLIGPAWIKAFPTDSFYDITATMPAGTTKEQFQTMLRNLLIERFHLAAHRETRNFRGYALVVDNGGPKFRELTPDPNPAADPRAVIDARTGSDGFPVVAGSRTMSQGSNGLLQTKYQERTMAEFASNLGFLIGSSQGRSASEGFPQPRVIDKTGLTGKYTFILKYYDASEAARDATKQDAANGSPAMPGDPPGGEFPGIFVAIQKQLGLRLDKVADVPMDMIVIERVDKVPIEN